MLRWWWLRTFY